MESKTAESKGDNKNVRSPEQIQIQPNPFLIATRSRPRGAMAKGSERRALRIAAVTCAFEVLRSVDAM